MPTSTGSCYHPWAHVYVCSFKLHVHTHTRLYDQPHEDTHQHVFVFLFCQELHTVLDEFHTRAREGGTEREGERETDRCGSRDWAEATATLARLDSINKSPAKVEGYRSRLTASRSPRALLIPAIGSHPYVWVEYNRQRTYHQWDIEVLSGYVVGCLKTFRCIVFYKVKQI